MLNTNRRSAIDAAGRAVVPSMMVVLAGLLAVIALRPSPQSAAVETEFAAPTIEASDSDVGSTVHDHASDPAASSHDHSDHVTTQSDPIDHIHPVELSLEAEPVGDHVHPADPATNTPTGPIISIDDPRLSAEQQQAARSLLVASRSSIASLPDETALAAAGYAPVGDNSSGMQHWVNDAYTHDGRELDPSRIESFMTERSSGRTTGAMYILEPGKSMSDVPDIAGELTIWHVHPTICFSDAQIWQFVSFTSNGTCRTGSSARDVPPMMHVWADDPVCGPFVGTEGHGSTTCSGHLH